MRHGVTDIYVDDATQKALWRLGDIDRISLRDGLGDEIEHLAATVKPIDGARGVMLAGSADGTSGATAKLLAEWEGQAGADDPVHRLRQSRHARRAAGQKRPRADHALERPPAASPTPSRSCAR